VTSSVVPIGEVIVTVDGSLESCSTDLVNGMGSCALTLAQPGTYTLTASFDGATGFLPGSDIETHVVKAISWLFLPVVVK
jgi:hypothetical protein